MAPPKKGLALLLGPAEEPGDDPAEMAMVGFLEAVAADDATEALAAFRTLLQATSPED